MTVPEDRVPRIQPFGDGAILATFGDRIDVALSRRIGALVTALDAQLAAGGLPGVVDLVPSYTTLVAIFDPRLLDRAVLAEAIHMVWDGLDIGYAAGTGRTVEIPVLYGGGHGPDLGDVAAHAGLMPDEVIARHAAGTYAVGALGFSPGFAFLIGLDPALATPRRATPRTVVPAGSVGIGGAQTGVYALPTPGGWSLIGRTPLRLVRPEAGGPDEAFLMRGGDTIRFVPIDAARFAELEADAAQDGAAAPMQTGLDPDAIAFIVLAPGLRTTVQDLGRPGMGRYGVAPGGAADRASLVAANRAVGNADDAAALEVTLVGPALRVMRPVRIALAGADLGATINGFPLAPGVAYDLRAGDVLAFDPARSAHGGVRAYLAVAGGVDVPVAMGSRSTDLVAGMGGIEGRPLRIGDGIVVGMATNDPAPGRVAHPFRAESGDDIIIRIVRGPQADRFDDTAWKSFLNGRFTVSSQSDRMGVRLDGPPIVPVGGADLISEGMVTGAVQVTNGGQPIVMLPARATIGGYAKIATVITTDLDRLGQAKPGAAIRFREISVEEATAVARGEFPDDAEPAFALADRDAVLKLVRDFSQFGLATLDLEIPATGVRLRLADRDAGSRNSG
ncbi:MAG: 5-oxoprolinase subunit PxpB [Thermomicrobiales bacterium]